MSDSPNIDPDLATSAPDEDAPDREGTHDAPHVDVTSPQEVDPEDGTDEDDKPIDNPAG
jgi:hypothetical protein